MKILFITDLYPVKQDEKITPRTLLDFVESWRSAGHEVDVIKPNFILNSFLRRKPFYKQGIYNGVTNLNYWTPFWFDVKKKACPFHFTSLENSTGNAIADQARNDETSLNSRLIQPSSYNLVIAHMPSGILFADKLGVPFIAGIHSSDLTVLTSPVYKFHFKKRMEKALKNAKAIACRSFVLKEKFLKLYPQYKAKTFTAPSGINERVIAPSPLTPLQQGAREQSPSLKILTCANYKKRKNIEKVLSALNGLDGFELTVIGDGTDRESLRKLNPDAVFKGYQPREKVLEIMKESDIFILPSEGETFGMVYLEAMASGCITICKTDDGIDGIIKNNENGFTVEPDIYDIRRLLIRIKNMDNNSLKLLLENSFSTVSRYTAGACAENYLQQIFKIM